MSLKELITLISKRDEIINNPPVLLDLGASGSLNPVWEPIANFCIGVAFDADSREFGFIENKTSAFKKLFVYNSIVTAKENQDKIKFYLTRSPYCSSTLQPSTEKLRPFHYSHLFDVTKTVELNAKNISVALKEMGIDRVDWFKTDTQGTDLQLFKSLPISLQSNCTVVQFEPGIIDAYENEDKLYHVLTYMETLPVRLYEFRILGPINISKDQFNTLFPKKVKSKFANGILKATPGWAEISYIKKFDSDVPNLSTRDFILGWLFMMMEKQYATAFTIASMGVNKYPNDSLMSKLYSFSSKNIKKEIYRIRNWKKILSTIKDKLMP